MAAFPTTVLTRRAMPSRKTATARALSWALHRYPQGDIRNIANWACQGHGSRIIPVCGCGMHAAFQLHTI
jgi:hypothetical protein